MHGGAKGSGAPKRNNNALKHGRYSAGAQASRLELRALLKESRELIATLSNKDEA